MPVTPPPAPVEAAQLALLAANNIDLVILARYMQVLSPEFVAAYPRRIINVHHSFLPASRRAPVPRRLRRGVKLIGATSHYVTETLDEGPSSSRTSPASRRTTSFLAHPEGRDLERMVLSRAVQWYLDHRILSYANKTVIFA